ncbi:MULTISPECIES: IS3 family transposase [Streptococcus]
MLPKWRNLTKDNITDIVKNHIIFYNETRIQRKLNGQSPVEYRKLVA